MREFWRGVATLGRGFGWWGRAPRLMATGLIPAAVVAVVFSAALLALGFAVPGIAQWATPFADAWDPFWATALRVVVAVAIVAGAVALAVLSFTAVALAVGEPVYHRIWRSVERAAGDVPDARYSLWRAGGDAVALVARGIGIGLLSLAIGLIPVVGAVLAAVTGAVLTGWALADELTQRALTARGLAAPARRALRRGARARVLGFGIATHLCFLVPGGAIAVMPAAVAGATLLAQDLVGATATAPGSPPARRA